MKKTVQARLDRDSEQRLKRLMAISGKSQSDVLREALKLLDACTLKKGKRVIAGLAEFNSGIKDLGSNPAHLAEYGK